MIETVAPREFDFGFSFISYGVTVGLVSDDPALLSKAKAVVPKAFGDRAEILERKAPESEHIFALTDEGGSLRLHRNGLEISAGMSEKAYFRFLNSMIRLEVAEYAKDRVFLHAGVVGWNGQAIVLPAQSYSGKSTLVAELVRNGAEYYSDEYAVLEENGYVEPFPRHVSIRYSGGTRVREIPPEKLGGRIGRTAIPVGMVLLTSFTKGAEWKPEVLTAGSGIVEVVPNAITIHRHPAFSLKVLDLVARRAIIVKSPRGDVKKFAKFLLAFFDKHTKLAKMT